MPLPVIHSSVLLKPSAQYSEDSGGENGLDWVRTLVGGTESVEMGGAAPPRGLQHFVT